MSRCQRTLNILAVAGLSFLLTSACGAKKNEGEGLSIAAQPGNEILIGPGPQSSCVDRAVFRSGGITLSTSVKGPVMVFNNFQMEWTSADTLYVQQLKWSVEGVGIKGFKYQTSITAGELEAVLGVLGSTFVGPSGVINSNDSARNRSTTFAPCGLALGDIPLTDPKDQTPFKARVTVEMIGTAEDAEGNQRFIRQRLTTTARFEGI